MIVRVTPSDILAALFAKLDTLNLGIKSYIFDPRLEIASSMTHHRSLVNSEFDPQNNKLSLPLFSWNRDSIKRDENTGRQFSGRGSTSSNLYNIGIIPAKMDVNFTIFASSIQDIEKIETDWLFETSINSVKSVLVKFGTEEQDYAINWPMNLDNLTIELSDVYHKALSGLVTVSGPVLSFNKVSISSNAFSRRST